ncbi:hypothetical protein CPIN18021_0909 [Campylobacter pinnipediorum subsp. caledonicus]|uniref:Uncharacterized protein n=1 Tax=Campylobacter pinnipediorum subsp. caledonicus TaxID=1874362 RepID=A0A1S6U7J7_9BACT|nr:pilus assembly protein PilO [Campylobacter pinnipediorum]AQW86109.1 hypothetical protein CPIN18020_0906 [Campylobacter pinnipediorum subsp. caledonicus]AQW87718.1 hypothetical protein CPIN18021_0909 [Campylobacter pinnipediorum subsp. caledonicus]OPA72153.1 pilus assembly protein PilO [Campylobacter pinnipediorum subsp. caledonicus]
MGSDILDKLDNYFEQKNQSEVSIIFIGAALFTIIIIYLIAFDSSTNFFESNRDRHADIDTKLSNTNHYLKSVSSADGDIEFEINRQTKALNLLNKTLYNKIEMNNYFDKRLRELSYLLFNEQNWANFVDNMVLLAKSTGIQILNLHNEFKNPGYQKIEQFLNIDIYAKGNFKSLINYINKIEESKLVVDLNKLDINSTDNDLDAKLGISVWGMKY